MYFRNQQLVKDRWSVGENLRNRRGTEGSNVSCHFLLVCKGPLRTVVMLYIRRKRAVKNVEHMGSRSPVHFGGHPASYQQSE